MTRVRISDVVTGEVVLEATDEERMDPTVGARAGAPDRATVTPLADGRVEVVLDGWRFEFSVVDADRADLRARATRGREAVGGGGPTEVRAIIPGRIVSVAVGPGDAVAAGARLLAVEAMKMENEVRAPRDGTVERVLVGVGQTVDLGDVLVVIG